MKITFFSTQPYDKDFFNKHNDGLGFTFEFLEAGLDEKTVDLVKKSVAVCVFVNDKVNRKVIECLALNGVKVIALRCAGFNNVDLAAAKENNISVCRVPAYSPQAVAEHAVAMILTLNRKTHKAYNRIREQNFSLNGLLGFDLHGKTVGVIGTGNIGRAFCKIMIGFGCNVVAFDLIANREVEALGVRYMPLMDVLAASHIISLHSPLNDQTHNLVNVDTIAMMKTGVMLINTSRGGLVDTKAVIDGLKSGKLGYVGIDVYEQEEKLFFRDLSAGIILDDVISRLISFPNVLITSHQGFFTDEALTKIAVVTLSNIDAILKNQDIEMANSLA
ncbi:2-hydroxyacid dehydrogenase [Segetibacter sp.]|jgi:D-lactate dehydrogenase|uniref:2-hydroxyacid dehydrogenase n=1 Tax=Segetibacter sp. TaxID=2231182 RepID=UPI0026219A56|nr:2-hydroxyacid dehydrogenase [Segetibacter sp.]MCW3080780.1 2-hydroxyacid dehydrogenase [Segetibacter sp.]